MASTRQGDGGPPPPPSDNTPSTSTSPPSAPDSRSPSFPPPARSSTAASLASTATNRLRSASLKLLDTDLPPGFMAATGVTAARMHSISDIRRGSLGGTGNNSPVTRNSSDDQNGLRKFSRTGTGLSMVSKGKGGAAEELKEEEEIRQGVVDGGSEAVLGERGTELETLRSVANRPSAAADERAGEADLSNTKKSTASSASRTVTTETEEGVPVTEYANGYLAPPKLPWTTSTALALKAYWKWVWTIPGFLITLYGLNVVAWGGMLFLLLCNASPAMCHPDCNALYSPRRVWIEIDSQILNALFCVTGFGLVPWRFRDCWWWAVWRFGCGKASWGATRAERRSYGLRRLAGINRGWFRLAGSEALPPTFPDHQDPQNPAKPRKPAKKDESGEQRRQDEGPVVTVPEGFDEKVLPAPLWKTPDPPPTGVRAPPTSPWKLDFVVWCNMWNTFLQACLAGFMWGLNRFDRPSWSTGLFVALACIVSAVGGLCIFLEGKAVKKVEGVPMESWRKNERVALDEEKAARLEERNE
ncbi:alpha-l-rhamnosidase c protein [Diplodia corticola]|uniref:Alpha-l-rhamnosidase c protein n=1 Tax=Diplodia corticola TaxID=236234 RepID=A0A1J9RKU1_9PEZI|nr:alpha-l-rhamnosidase c protein [Diplodia corticola]OJD29135.1 alpha-l-rhamnosidase c protein [Diplodia corticola]